MKTSRRDQITDCLKQFSDLSEIFKVICTQACMLERSIQSIQDLTEAEVIGREKANRKSSRKISSHLAESLDDFTKILISAIDSIRGEAIEAFDNFIIEAIAPSDDEIKGIHEHNSQIIVKLNDAFYSMFNHFLALSAELLENFLLCSGCSSPIGFSHPPHCCMPSPASKQQSIWRKTKYDDKFITFGMKFSFYDIVSSEYRHNVIRKSIERACWEQKLQLEHASSTSRSKEESQQFIPRNWPSLWLRDDSERLRDKRRAGGGEKHSRSRSYPETIATSPSLSPDNANFSPPPQLAPLFLASRWTPNTDDDIELLTTTQFLRNTSDADQDGDGEVDGGDDGSERQ